MKLTKLAIALLAAVATVFPASTAAATPSDTPAPQPMQLTQPLSIDRYTTADGHTSATYRVLNPAALDSTGRMQDTGFDKMVGGDFALQDRVSKQTFDVAWTGLTMSNPRVTDPDNSFWVKLDVEINAQPNEVWTIFPMGLTYAGGNELHGIKPVAYSIGSLTTAYLPSLERFTTAILPDRRAVMSSDNGLEPLDGYGMSSYYDVASGKAFTWQYVARLTGPNRLHIKGLSLQVANITPTKRDAQLGRIKLYEGIYLTPGVKLNDGDRIRVLGSTEIWDGMRPQEYNFSTSLAEKWQVMHSRLNDVAIGRLSDSVNVDIVPTTGTFQRNIDNHIEVVMRPQIGDLFVAHVGDSNTIFDQLIPAGGR